MEKNPLEKSPVVIKVKQISIHPEFNNRTVDNDLALLQLETPVYFDSHIGTMIVGIIKDIHCIELDCHFQCQFACQQKGAISHVV